MDQSRGRQLLVAVVAMDYVIEVTSGDDQDDDDDDDCSHPKYPPLRKHRVCSTLVDKRAFQSANLSWSRTRRRTPKESISLCLLLQGQLNLIT